MKRRAFLSALLALPVAPLAIKGLAEETPAPPPETDFPEGYRTFVWKDTKVSELQYDMRCREFVGKLQKLVERHDAVERDIAIKLSKLATHA